MQTVTVFSGHHRALGSNLSKVRSLKMDNKIWTEPLIQVRVGWTTHTGEGGMNCEYRWGWTHKSTSSSSSSFSCLLPMVTIWPIRCGLQLCRRWSSCVRTLLMRRGQSSFRINTAEDATDASTLWSPHTLWWIRSDSVTVCHICACPTYAFLIYDQCKLLTP